MLNEHGSKSFDLWPPFCSFIVVAVVIILVAKFLILRRESETEESDRQQEVRALERELGG